MHKKKKSYEDMRVFFSIWAALLQIIPCKVGKRRKEHMYVIFVIVGISHIYDYQKNSHIK